MPSFPLVPSLLLALAVTDSVLAQSNTVPGLNIRLEDTYSLQRYRRTGTYPNGVQAIGMYSKCCNPGSVAIPFQAAMNPNHGFIHYILAREANGRFEQISNYAWVKHTFGSNNDPSTCGTCVNQATTSFVEPGCNDIYANTQAVDHFNLGPPGEVDPWLGAWNPVCSHFDVGNPPVVVSQQCDGIRSLTQTQATTLNAQISEPVDMEFAHRSDPGHFDVTAMAFRDWDADGEVPATCARCHSATGLPEWIHNGSNPISWSWA